LARARAREGPELRRPSVMQDEARRRRFPRSATVWHGMAWHGMGLDCSLQYGTVTSNDVNHGNDDVECLLVLNYEHHLQPKTGSDDRTAGDNQSIGPPPGTRAGKSVIRTCSAALRYCDSMDSDEFTCVRGLVPKWGLMRDGRE